jgi:D-sedoheptulose 7-phosphate isomerase
MKKKMKKKITSIIEQSISTKQKILNDPVIMDEIQSIVEKVTHSLSHNGRLYLAGNGGSAADSQHIAAEFVCRLYDDRQAFSAIALTTDTSTLTAIGNDYGFDALFARQLQAHLRENDIFIAISTSGNSTNIIQAIEYCKLRKITVIGFSGESGGKMQDLCDICLKVPTTDTARIQESHILFGHIICSLVEQNMAE